MVRSLVVYYESIKRELKIFMSVGVMKDYKLKLRNLRASHTLEGVGIYMPRITFLKKCFLCFLFSALAEHLGRVQERGPYVSACAMVTRKMALPLVAALALALHLESPRGADAYFYPLAPTSGLSTPHVAAPRGRAQGIRAAQLPLAAWRSALVRGLLSAGEPRGGIMRPDVTPLLAISGKGGDLAREAVNIELTNAIQLNDLLVIQDMVQGGLVDGGLALARVAQVGGTGEMLRLLLQMGAKPDATDEFGRTAIMLAVSRRDKQLTEQLLSAGANVEGIGGTYNGRTALMQAACSGATEMVTLLLANGADPAATDRYGRNVIQQAAVMRREDTVRILEKHMKEQARRQAQGSEVPQEPASRGLVGFFGGQSAPAPAR